MSTSIFGQNKTRTRFFIISTFVILSLSIIPTPVYSEDSSSIATLRQMGKAFSSIAEKASPAVVGIRAEKTVTQEYQTPYNWPFGEPFDPFGDDLFDYFFRRRSPHRQQPRQRSRQTAQGSGFIISPDGYILTNNHLVGEAEKIVVKLSDEREMEAKVIGTDPESDVAVVKIDVKNASYLELANSDKLEVGEWVIAIGNPFGLSHSVTAGIVSAKGRSRVGITAYEDFIQTDAAINPGNSGGPLLNLDGKAVGINTAIVSRSGGNLGIGLAIPVNMAKAIYDQLVDSGTVVRGFLGISMTELTPELAEEFDLKNAKGVAIAEVIKDSAAEKAGLKRNDVIVEFEGQPVEKAGDLRNRVAMLKPGTKVKMVVLRGGKRKEFTAELGERPAKGQIAGMESETLKQLGITVQNLTDDLAERLGYKGESGVVVSSVESGSIAEYAGITPGTLIMEVGRRPVKNTKDFKDEVEKDAEDGSVLLLVRDQNYTRFVVLTLPKK